MPMTKLPVRSDIQPKNVWNGATIACSYSMRSVHEKRNKNLEKKKINIASHKLIDGTTFGRVSNIPRRVSGISNIFRFTENREREKFTNFWYRSQLESDKYYNKLEGKKRTPLQKQWASPSMMPKPWNIWQIWIINWPSFTYYLQYKLSIEVIRIRHDT